MNGDPLHLSHVGFTYPDGRRAIDDVSLRLRPRESVGLIGPNGAGKTTLFLLISGLLQPQSGEVKVLGRSYGEGFDQEIRRHLGVVFQETEDQLFSPSVREDVAFGPENFGMDARQIDEGVSDALAFVGLAGFEERVPHHLSSGERRRVALATVLAYGPDVLILDEPTSDLDPRGQRDLITRLDETSQARLVASHDLPFILLSCDRVLVLESGRIHADGPAVDILTDRALLERHGLAAPVGWNGLTPQGAREIIREAKR